MTAGSPEDPDPRDPLPEDEAWRRIIANYGERAELDDDAPVPARPAPPVDDEAHDRDPWPEPAEEHFVPPPVPATPIPRGPRLVAWLGLVGAPALVLVLVLLSLDLPGAIGVVLLAWFVGGFVYLVASMRSGPPDAGDDGAVV